MKIIFLKGLPGSGKSTWALEQVSKHENIKRVNKDDLRAMVDGGTWSKSREKHILEVRDWFIAQCLQHGHDVIVDDTNFAPKHEERIREIAKEYKATTEVKFFDTPVEECIERDSKRTKPVGENVIRDMYKQFLYKPTPPPEHNDNFMDIILCDIDGTLALMTDRGPFEWNKVGQDILNKPIVDLVRKIYQTTPVIIFSGRDAICRKETTDWLEKHAIPYKELVMRSEGDNRKDSIVKKELYEKYIKDKYNVKFILDDRDQVVEMWRGLGLTCLQVAYGDF